MKSDHVTDLLHDYIDDALSSTDALAVTRHLESCVQCGSAYSELRALRNALAQLPAPSPDPVQFERMLRFAVRTRVAQAARWRGPIWNRAGQAAAAVLLLLLGFGLGLQTAQRNRPGPQIVLVAQRVVLAQDAQTIGLIFRASSVVQNAKISLWLPKDVQIAGRPNVRHLSWRTDLKQGPNLLEVPLVATGTGDSSLVVRISQGSLVKTLEVPIVIRPSATPAAKSSVPRGLTALS